MRTTCRLFIATLFIGASLTPCLAAKPSPDEVTVVNDNAAFAVDLYGKLSAADGNLFFSPYSISTALAMTYAGARGKTETQMADALHFSLNPQRLHPAFKELEERLNKVQEKGHVKLAVANSLWPHKKYPFLKDYLSLVKTQYGATITPVDYARNTEGARTTINTWVEHRTEQKIRNLIPRGILDQLTRLVLVNAIYFKGNWASQFKTAATRDAPFHVTPGKTVQAPLMTQKQKFRYMETPQLQVLELPYVGDQLSMVVLLPKEQHGLATVEAELSAKSLRKWTDDLYEREIRVFLPKFKMTSTFQLNQALRALGMTDAFTMKADLSGMDGTRSLYIHAVLHKGFVEVNEEGTEAAAATAVVVRVKSIPPPTPEFRADHPFLFLVRDTETGSILFMGRVTDPNQAGD